MKSINEKVTTSIRALLADRRRITTGVVARHADVSAPTAYNALKSMVAAGTLEHVGAGRGAYFRPIQHPLSELRERRDGLDEAALWMTFAELSAIKELQPNVRTILHIAFSEMANNAIDHSHGANVTIRLLRSNGILAFEIEDDGVGIFNSVMEKLALKTPFEAIAELQKGKVTTSPEAHSGLGIFFTSKMADRMTLDSGKTRWLIDTAHEDQAVEVIDNCDGTRVRFNISVTSARRAKEVYDRFSSIDEGVTRSRTYVKLFRGDSGTLVSRSEAKRLLVGLEKFQEVDLDFRDVQGIAQGFADEVFRVWQREHPETKLTPVNANPAVTFMIGAARGNAEVSQPVAAGKVNITARGTVTGAPATTAMSVSTGDEDGAPAG